MHSFINSNFNIDNISFNIYNSIYDNYTFIPTMSNIIITLYIQSSTMNKKST